MVSLGLQSLPSTDLGRLDEEEASPGVAITSWGLITKREGREHIEKLRTKHSDVPPLGSTSLEVSAQARGVGLSSERRVDPGVIRVMMLQNEKLIINRLIFFSNKESSEVDPHLAAGQFFFFNIVADLKFGTNKYPSYSQMSSVEAQSSETDMIWK
ncbi:hypothetical protein TNCV_3341611 [Trichonephila clavipes]|nr:hypothetical protein TNCV_3341611 [Trichonephila clavipes]